MEDESTAMQLRCATIVAELNDQRGWHLNAAQQQAYVAALLAHLHAPCADDELRTQCFYYHEDHALVHMLQDADHPQHAEIWARQMARVIAILQRAGLAWTQDVAIECEDLAQLALLELVQALPTYRYTSRFSTWAYSVVVRRIRRYFRDCQAQKRAVRPLSLEASPDLDVPEQESEGPESAAEGQALAELVHAVLKAQNGHLLAEVFLLWARHDLRLEQIGEHIQRSPSWTRALLKQARTRLQDDAGIQAWYNPVESTR